MTIRENISTSIRIKRRDSIGMLEVIERGYGKNDSNSREILQMTDQMTRMTMRVRVAAPISTKKILWPFVCPVFIG